MSARWTVAAASTLVLLFLAPVSGQWLSHRMPDVPRLPDGRPNLDAPTPHTPDGTPVLAGLWRPSPGITGDITRGMSSGEEVPFRPWAEALFDARVAIDSREDPTANCIVGGVPRSDFVGYPLKIVETSGLVVILYEAVHGYRQIFTDGRELPRNPNPAWFGYSVGAWEGEAFVVRSAGFNDNVWLDNKGRPGTESLRVTERFVRTDFGHMDITVTIDDPKAYTRPWTVVQPLVFQPDTELLEYICNENNRYFDLVDVPGAGVHPPSTP